MTWIQRLGTVVVLLFMVTKSAVLSSNDFFNCENTVKNWAESSNVNGIKEDKFILKDLLFFLHVPRTGGRTYFYCFLRKLYTSDQECPRSYDKLHFDPRKSNCRLMVTHDDYSLTSKLPKDRTSVVTILRNPIDRVFSTYEFSVEVAARFLVHPNLTSVMPMSGRIRAKSRGVSTLDIWPWKFLVPWMREDLFSRRDVRNLVRSRWTTDIGNPYDMEDMVMPFQAFINEPLAHEIIHNGATFQVAGLTNNSNIDESHKVRHCVRNHPSLGQYVLEIAKNRLDRMLYVGLTEDHKESATMFASMVGAQVLSQSDALSSPSEEEASSKTERSSFEDSDDGRNHDQNSISSQQAEGVSSPTPDDTKNRSMTVGELMEAYEVCTSSLRKSQGSRRSMSLKRISPAKFSKEARLLVPEKVLQEILSLNHLDVELYKHAQDIFLQQQKHLMQRNQEILKQQHVHLSSRVVASISCDHTNINCTTRKAAQLTCQICGKDSLLPSTTASKRETQGLGINLQGCTPWKVISSIVLAFLFIIIIFLLVTARRRRTSKLKV